MTILACPNSQKCYNATYRLEKDLGGGIKVFVDGSFRGCVNAVNCSDLYAYGKSLVEKEDLKMVAGRASCCDGDFCNLGASVPTPGDYFVHLIMYYFRYKIIDNP